MVTQRSCAGRAGNDYCLPALRQSEIALANEERLARLQPVDRHPVVTCLLVLHMPEAVPQAVQPVPKNFVPIVSGIYDEGDLDDRDPTRWRAPHESFANNARPHLTSRC